MPHEIMTIEEVAEYLRVSERTVYDWAQKGQLPGGKLGTTWRFKRTDIEHWVSSRLGATPPAPASQTTTDSLKRILSPDRVVFRHELPTTPTGKVLRRQLADELKSPTA